MRHNNKIKIAVFPVAGMGTRFLPITKTISKEMLNVLDRPLLDYAVEEAKTCLLYTSPSPRDPKTSRMPSSA